jgi:hypothetical protein
VNEPTREIVFEPSRMSSTREIRGDMRMSYAEAHQVRDELAAELADVAKTGLVVYAGPLELVLAAVGAIGGATAGVSGLLDRWAARHPETRVTIKLDEQTTVTLTGNGIPASLEERLDDFILNRGSRDNHAAPAAEESAQVDDAADDVAEGEDQA